MRKIFFIWLLLFAASAVAQQYDYLIRNGRVVDGSGNPYIYADLGITGDKIAFVGRAPAGATAKHVIDATGLIVAPGFIDMLGQSELNLLIDKRAVSKLTQGITTEVTGEGESVAPQSDATIAHMRDFLEHYHLTIDWRDLDGYFRRLEQQGSGINLATYVGAAQVREVVIGTEDRAPTEDELRRMQGLVDQAMRQGAMGVSTALIYAPGNYAGTDELIALASVAAKYGSIYASHIRSESDAEPAALEEAFRIGRQAQLPVEIFHLKVAGKQYWGRMRNVVETITANRDRGEDITADQYPYLAGATSLGATIPPKYHAGGTDAFIARLKDPGVRAEIRRQLTTPSVSAQGFENWWRLTGGPDGILVNPILNPRLKQYEGKTVAQIAKMQNKDPLDALMDLVIADRDNAGAIYFVMSEDDVVTAMKQPWVSVGTDYEEVAPDGPLADTKAHPRAYGCFPRILSRYTQLPIPQASGPQKPLTLEFAIRKFTSLAAQRVHLDRRGLLRPDYFADITIFNPQTIRDVATYEDPNRPSVGIEYVFVNGVLSIDHGKLTGRFGGRPLRGPGYRPASR